MEVMLQAAAEGNAVDDDFEASSEGWDDPGAITGNASKSDADGDT